MSSVKKDLDSILSFLNVKDFPAAKVSESSALVLGLTSGTESKPSPTRAAKGAAKSLETAFRALASQASFEGKAGSVITLLDHSTGLQGLGGYKHLLGAGVGAPKDFHAQNILSWGARVAQQLRSYKIATADLYLDSFYNPADSAKSKEAPRDFAGRSLASGIPSKEEFLEKLCLGILLGLYRFDRYKSKIGQKKAEAKDERPQLRILSQFIDENRGKEIVKKAQILAEGVCLTRDLQTIPGGDLQPEALARQAQEAGRAAGFSVTVWDEKKLKSEGMNGILTVGMGSDAPPRFIILEHNAAKKNLPTVVLVGKGITFDTGGVCIKPAPGMEEMKMDMSGGASVVGALYILAKLKTPMRVIGLISSAENMCGGRAVRPGDIYTAHDGHTVEVINTDAEGRLVLADALSYAKNYKPDCVIDIATLTGAVIIALGHVTTGIMGNNAELIEGFRKASDKAGERTWELPLYDEYEDDMKSKVADIKNVGSDRGAGSSKAGAFLNYFVKGAYPWIHLDVAGTADTPKGQGPHCPPDVGTGVPVRGLVEFVVNFDEYFGRRKE